MTSIPANILGAYGLNPNNYSIQQFGSGLINNTWKVAGTDKSFILQRINTNVFRSPQDIADNLDLLQQYLRQIAPEYIFAAPLPAINGQLLAIDNGNYYRLLPFIKNSHSVDTVSQSSQAYEAAKQFGKFSRLLKDFDIRNLKYTLPDFHNLSLRVQQYQTALQNAHPERLTKAGKEITAVKKHAAIAQLYEQLVTHTVIPLRVIHHDTKINNVLFDDADKGLCVIDLDTIMPGYYISDVGDMMRTYLSPVNEEEQNFDKIHIREDHFIAIYKGYIEEMGEVLTIYEKSLFFYAGKFMVYMQALRFLTDYLNGDIYYPTAYPLHNLTRAQNQLMLLTKYIQSEEKMMKLINNLDIVI